MGQPGLSRGAHDDHGMSPLHLAVQKNDVPMLRLLLTSARHRVSLEELSLRTDLGWAPLHTAAFHGFELATRLLEGDKHSQPDPPNVPRDNVPTLLGSRGLQKIRFFDFLLVWGPGFKVKILKMDARRKP